MTDSTILPGQRAALVDRNGTTTLEFYRFFRSLSVTADLPARVDDLTVRVTALEEGDSTAGNVVGKQSIISAGVLSNGLVLLRLDGDVDVAPALSFYGALTAGAKGWQTYSENFSALENGDGTSSLDLADLADSGTGAALVKITRDAKGRVSGTHSATTTDLAEGSNLYYTDARADARITLQKAQPLGLATLDAAGKLDAGQLPALAITETFVVNTQAAMLALSAQEGDVAVRTDLSKSFILTAAPASTLSNWQELLTPASPVTSIFGRVGSVTAATGDYTFAQIGSTPTTLAGYGITDAEPTIAAGTAAQYWRGDKSWRDFATDVRAAVLAGLSTATNAVITTADTVLSALGKLQTQITDNLLPKGYIDGLGMLYVGPTSVTIKSGAAYILGAGKVVRNDSDMALTGIAIGASAWGHIYVYASGGVLAAEVSATVPAAPYNGTARSKTGDTSRRYIGSVKTDASGNLYNFLHSSTSISYRNVQGAVPFRALSNGTSLAETSVSLSAVVPQTSRLVFIRVINTATSAVTAQIYTGTSDDSASGPPTSGIMTFDPSKDGFVNHPLDSSQAMTYWYRTAPSGGGAYMDVYGYNYDR
mgnify:CR=1 FL=1